MSNKKINPQSPCSECEGSGEIYFGMKPGFNVKNMEITANDDTRMCSSCEGLGLVESEEAEQEDNDEISRLSEIGEILEMDCSHLYSHEAEELKDSVVEKIIRRKNLLDRAKEIIEARADLIRVLPEKSHDRLVQSARLAMLDEWLKDHEELNK